MTRPVAGWSPQGQWTVGIDSADCFFRQHAPLAADAFAARRQHPHEQARDFFPQQQLDEAPDPPGIPPAPTGTPTLPAISATSVVSAARRRSDVGW
jgi:hypothetical protein